MMEFLYFPEDKTEYIPAVITLLFFVIGAVITMYFLYKYSKKEEKQMDEKYASVPLNSSVHQEKND